MKQILVMTNDRERYEKALPTKDFYITWCALSMEELLEKRANSNLILLCMDHEDKNFLKNLGLYLREACLEDEKILYLYGNKEDVDTISSLVPSMFIKKALYSFAMFDAMVDELVQQEVMAENGKPCCVIIDDDAGYVERLRVHLDGLFRVVVCGFDPHQINDLVKISDVVLISVDGKLKLSEFMGLFHLLLARKRIPGFRFYYLTPSDSERNAINLGMEKSSLSFSKEMDVERVAAFLIDQFKMPGSIS